MEIIVNLVLIIRSWVITTDLKGSKLVSTYIVSVPSTSCLVSVQWAGESLVIWIVLDLVNLLDLAYEVHQLALVNNTRASFATYITLLLLGEATANCSAKPVGVLGRFAGSTTDQMLARV